MAGTHGKTTTTSLVGTVLTEAGLDPTVIVGGRLRLLGTGARLGKSEYLVAEADEFDRSFLRLTPVIAVITNIDRDHLDTYGDLAAIQDAFVEFASRVPFFGRADRLPRRSERAPDPAAHGGPPHHHLRLLAAGRSVGRGRPAAPAARRFSVRAARRPRRRHDLGEIDLPMPGRHNVLNALGAVGVGPPLRIPFEAIARAIAGFERRAPPVRVPGRVARRGRGGRLRPSSDRGRRRRSRRRARAPRAAGCWPSSSRTSSPAPSTRRRLRQRAPGRRPGRGQRRLRVARAAGPRRHRRAGGRGRPASGHRNVRYCPSWKDAPGMLGEMVREGDVIVTLGAGDVNRLAKQLVEDGEIMTIAMPTPLVMPASLRAPVISGA